MPTPPHIAFFRGPPCVTSEPDFNPCVDIYGGKLLGMGSTAIGLEPGLTES